MTKAQVITEGDDKDLGFWKWSRCKAQPGSCRLLAHHLLAQHGLLKHTPALGGADTVYYTTLLAFFMSNLILEGCVRVLLWAQPCWLYVQIEAFYLLKPHLVQHSPREFQLIPLVKQTDTQNHLKN